MRRRKPSRLLAACLTALVLPAAAASPAAAWTTNAPVGGGGLATTFTLPGPVMGIGITGQTNGFICTGSTLRGRFGGPTVGSWLNDPAAGGTPFQPAFTGCTVNGSSTSPVTFGCATSVQLHAVNFNADVTTMHLRVLSCSGATVPPSACSMNLQGNGPLGRAMIANYDNGTTGLGTSTLAQTMQLSWSGCPFFAPSTGSGAVQMSILTNPTLHWVATTSPAPVITP